jgi:Tol biopolymer transport system component/dienelactone hydrolase
MKNITNFRYAVLTVCTVLLVLSCTNSSEKEAMTADDYKKATHHLSKTMNPLVYNTITRSEWMDDSHFIYLKQVKGGRNFVFVSVDDKSAKPAFDHERLASALSSMLDKEYTALNLPFFGVTMNDKMTSIEFTISGKNYICDLNDYSLSEVNQPKFKAGRNEFVSPDGKLAAYIKDYNLWVKSLETGKETQLTFDGEKDFVYAKNNAGWVKSDGPVLKWSPNSDKIATFQQDARGVGEMYLTSTNVGHPRLEAWKHPLPGDAHVFKLERVVIHLGSTPQVVRLKMENDFQRGTITDHVAGRGGTFLDCNWSTDGNELAFISSSRDHKIAHLKTANVYTGDVRSVLIEEVETYFESGNRAENWRVFHDTKEVLWFSERDDWGHLYLYDLESKALKHQITSGEWAVQQVRHIDRKNRVIYFTGGGKEPGNPYHQYLYRIDFDGNNMINLTPDKGTHAITPSDNWDYFVDTYSSVDVPPVSVLRSNTGQKIMDLETAEIEDLKANGWQQPIEFTVKARDGETDLWGIMYLPSDYDENKKYPVLNYIYPGPQAGSVGYYGFRASSRDRQPLAELGFVVVGVDAMGTPGRSKSFHDFYYGNMGDNGIPDNITTIKQLADRYKGMDITRVGIWGHSGGGFASTGALFRYPDFYDVAVSGAGNHDNRNYEADWGEKWQGLLTRGKLETSDDGTTNYDNQANQLVADQLKGKLLITHGSMDNNVPPSNTMLVVEALIKANKDFDLILFPNKRHGYGDMTNYMTRRKWDYFVKHLKNMEPPKEFPLDEL